MKFLVSSIDENESFVCIQEEALEIFLSAKIDLTLGIT